MDIILCGRTQQKFTTWIYHNICTDDLRFIVTALVQQVQLLHWAKNKENVLPS